MNNPDKSKGNPKAPKTGGLIPKRPDWKEAWNRLKKYVSPPHDSITEVEKLLLTNDSEKLELDHLYPTHDPTSNPGIFKPMEKSSAGATYLNTTMNSYYG